MPIGVINYDAFAGQPWVTQYWSNIQTQPIVRSGSGRFNQLFKHGIVLFAHKQLDATLSSFTVIMTS
jgi:hypothetical protein